MAEQDKGQGFGSQLPGTGGDYIDTADVEGHRAIRYPFTDDGSQDAIRRATPEEGDDVEGHRAIRYPFTDDGSQDTILRNPRIPSDDGSDVEGHLFRNGPTTQGEIIARVPRDNPHGER